MKDHQIAPLSPTSGSLRPARGFTLIELMIAVVVVGLLAAVALPSFLDSMRKSRRSEAFGALTLVQQAQERWRSNRATYTTYLTPLPTDTPPGLGLPATSKPNDYYNILVSAANATGYTVTATATAGSQANDTGCQTLTVQIAAGNITYTSGGSPDTDLNRCWVR